MQTIVLIGSLEFRTGDGVVESVTVFSGEGRGSPSVASVVLADPFLRLSGAIELQDENVGGATARAPAPTGAVTNPTTQVVGNPIKDPKIPVEIYIDAGTSEILSGDFEIVSRDGTRGTGYDSQYLVFAGYLAEITATINSTARGYGRLTINATDKGRSLRTMQRVRVLSDVNAAEVVELIAQENSLGRVAFQGTARERLARSSYAQRLSRGTTDIELLEELLNAHGCTYHITSNVLYVREVGALLSEEDGAPPSTVVLSPGNAGNIMSATFKAEATNRSFLKNVYSVAGVPYEIAEADASEAQRRTVRLERTGLALDAKNLPSFTDQTIELSGKAQAASRKVFTGQVVLNVLQIGVWPGHQVLLRGLGPRWSGVWNVQQVTHYLQEPYYSEFGLYNGGAEDTTVDAFIGDTVYFRFDKDTIEGDVTLTTLDRVFARMQESPGFRYMITGHTDPRGTEIYNTDLGLRRAQSVKNWLVAKGIPAYRLSVETAGELQLASSENNALNRRAEFRVL